MKTKDVQKLYSEFILPTYTQIPVCLVRGRGSRVWDIEDKEYLDFFDNIDKYIKDFHQNYPKFHDNIIRYVYWYIFDNTIKLPTLSGKGLLKTDLLQLKKEDLTLDQKLIKILNQF